MSDLPLRPILLHYGWDLGRDRTGWHTIQCNAHEDRNKSCRVTYNDGGYIQCMACDFKGDAIDVVIYYEGLDFKNAVRRAEELTGKSSDTLSRNTHGARYGTAVPDRSRGRGGARGTVSSRRSTGGRVGL